MPTSEQANPRVVDLFAGCGGMTQGFVSLGFTPVLAVESDVVAASTYAANFGPDHVFARQVQELTEPDLRQAEVVIGGPPCQGFSGLGANDPQDPRNRLWREYMRIVRAVDPQVFVIENVDRFSRSDEFRMLMGELRDGSLRRWEDVSVDVLDAADYGVPQRRRRTIIVASRVGPVQLPAPTNGPDGSGRPMWRTVRHALRRVPLLPEDVDLPASWDEPLGLRVPGLFKSPELHVTRRPTARSLLRYAHIPPGGGRFDLPYELQPPCWQRKPTGTSDVMGRLDWDKPSVTIRTEFFKPEKGRYLHPQWDRTQPDLMVNRPITHFEAALLQTFPRSFRWAGTKTQIARQIGNAVPPVLAAAVARDVLNVLT